MRKLLNGILIFSALIISLEGNAQRSPDFLIQFSKPANGGILTLSHGFNPRNQYVSIQTQPGESADSVTRRLLEAVKATGEAFSSFPLTMASSPSGLALGVFDGPVYFTFAGTETGLGIPQPPNSFTAVYDATRSQIHAHWINPPGGYDWIYIGTHGLRRLPGNSTSIVLTNIILQADSEFDIRLIGLKGRVNPVPSNAVEMRIRPGYQEELIDSPYTDNVMPNWLAWSRDTGEGRTQLVEGRKTEEVRWNPKESPDHPEEKYFFQMIKGTGAGFQGGIWRKFFGLTPGRTYKVSVRVNTLKSKPPDEDWWFSAHAAHNGPTGADLTTDQLAGVAALPDGSQGPQAGQFAKYDKATASWWEWTERSTDKDGPGKVIGNITLPPGVNVITVWLKHGSNSGPSNGVGMDWVALEDVTQPKP